MTATDPALVFHIAAGDDWRAAESAGSYRAASLETEGFLHFSKRDQVLGAADRYLLGVPGLVLLEIRVDQLGLPMTWEDTTGSGERFPHLYGPLPIAAVRRARRFPERLSGGYDFPPEAPTSLRLRFEEWTPEDLPCALELWGDPEVTRWIDARERLDTQAVEAMLRRERGFATTHGIQYWKLSTLVERDFIGCAGLRPRPDGRPELGFHLCRRHWGRGFGTEAAAAITAFAFEVLLVPGLYAGHAPENEGSRKILQGLGFYETGDELFEPTGTMHPSYRLDRS